jgi:ABC-type amino acid transport substrate-binding protein
MCCLAGGTARAAGPVEDEAVLLTENFAPFNMAEDERNFARDEHIHGIDAATARETVARLQQALDGMRADGTLQRIAGRYLREAAPP